MRQLKVKNQQLYSENQVQETKIQQQETKNQLLENALDSTKQNLELKIVEANHQIDLLRTIQSADNVTLVHMIKHASSLVAFNAYVDHQQLSLSPPTHIQFNQVLYNEGQGFNPSTSEFIAPVSGSYFLMFHSQALEHSVMNSVLKVEGTIVAFCYSLYGWGHGVCPAVVHMNRGHRAWVEPDVDTRSYITHSTSFSGFLFRADP